MWSPPDLVMPIDFPVPKSWVADLSFEVSFVSVLVMVLSEYIEKGWKNILL